MSANALLSRLDGLRVTAKGRWIARCPSHDDRTPSLSIRELEDGRVLLKCFGGCESESVLTALGLGFADLYPKQVVAEGKRVRNPWTASDLIHLLDRESLIVLIVACDAIGERVVTQDTVNRVLQARTRIAAIVGALCH
jgi:hypothetical protein